jgi:large subunit ribosomal protein L25
LSACAAIIEEPSSMPEIATLGAEPRGQAGKGAARALRRRGRVPAILYGGGELPAPISLDPGELSRLLARRAFFATLVDLEIEGKRHRTLPREVQYHPVTAVPLHVDFMRIGATARVIVEVPVVFINHEMSIGLRRGGILNIVRHEIELDCPVGAIPDRLSVDLSGLDIGDSVHISAVAVPEGCRPRITDRDFTIASIAASSALREEASTVTAPATTQPAAPA